MRLWMTCIRSLGSVVTIVQENIVEPSGESHRSHRPANAKGFPDFSRMYIGVLVLLPGFCFHSKKPLAGIRQRRRRKAVRNEGFSANVSALALIILLPMVGSFAQEGIRPQTKKLSWFCPSFGMTATGWLGAMLKAGAYAFRDVHPRKCFAEIIWICNKCKSTTHRSPYLRFLKLKVHLYWPNHFPGIARYRPGCLGRT